MEVDDQLPISACGAACRAIFARGEVTEPQRKQLRAGRMKLRRFIHELSADETGKKASCFAAVLKALQQLHPRKTYACCELMIRDLADLCATMHSLEGGIIKNDRLTELTCFCEFWRYTN